MDFANGESIEVSNLYLEKELLAPYTHIMKVRGKEIRKKIPNAFNEWLNLPEEKLHYITNAIHALHNATILYDDIQDNTVLRHGLPAAHCAYGVPLVVNTGTHIIMLVLEGLEKLNHPMIGQIFSEDFIEIIRGQGKELYWRENYQCPTQEQYEHVAKQKTGYMFRIAIRVMQLFSDFKTDLADLATTLGMYFQMRDDYYNLVDEEVVEEWPTEPSKQPKKNADFYCEDICEGKFTLPLIHAIRSPEGHAVFSILCQHTRDYNLKKFCHSELQRLGSLQHTRERLQAIEKYVAGEIERLGGNSKLTAVLEEIAVK